MCDADSKRRPARWARTSPAAASAVVTGQDQAQIEDQLKLGTIEYEKLELCPVDGPPEFRPAGPCAPGSPATTATAAPSSNPAGVTKSTRKRSRRMSWRQRTR